MVRKKEKGRNAALSWQMDRKRLTSWTDNRVVQGHPSVALAILAHMA